MSDEASTASRQMESGESSGQSATGCSAWLGAISPDFTTTVLLPVHLSQRLMLSVVQAF